MSNPSEILPELPEPEALFRVGRFGRWAEVSKYDGPTTPLFTADQMREYARRALEGRPSLEPSDESLQTGGYVPSEQAIRNAVHLIQRFWSAVQRPAGEDLSVAKLAAFGAWCFADLRDNIGSDIDGGDAQDEMERLGILGRVWVTEACGEHCSCADYGEFPQDCLRATESVRAYLKDTQRSSSGARSDETETGKGST